MLAILRQVQEVSGNYRGYEYGESDILVNLDKVRVGYSIQLGEYDCFALAIDNGNQINVTRESIERVVQVISGRDPGKIGK